MLTIKINRADLALVQQDIKTLIMENLQFKNSPKSHGEQMLKSKKPLMPKKDFIPTKGNK